MKPLGIGEIDLDTIKSAGMQKGVCKALLKSGKTVPIESAVYIAFHRHVTNRKEKRDANRKARRDAAPNN